MDGANEQNDEHNLSFSLLPDLFFEFMIIYEQVCFFLFWLFNELSKIRKIIIYI